MDSDEVAFLRADVERFCGELVELPPAIRLRLVTELRAALDAVTTVALMAGMTAAQQEGWDCAGSRSSPVCRTSRSGGCWRPHHPARAPTVAAPLDQMTHWAIRDERQLGRGAGDGAARAARLAAYRAQGIEIAAVVPSRRAWTAAGPKWS